MRVVALFYIIENLFNILIKGSWILINIALCVEVYLNTWKKSSLVVMYLKNGVIFYSFFSDDWGHSSWVQLNNW